MFIIKATLNEVTGVNTSQTIHSKTRLRLTQDSARSEEQWSFSKWEDSIKAHLEFNRQTAVCQHHRVLAERQSRAGSLWLVLSGVSFAITLNDHVVPYSIFVAGDFVLMPDNARTIAQFHQSSAQNEE